MALIKKSDIGKLTNNYEIDNLKKENEQLKETLKKYKTQIDEYEDILIEKNEKKNKKIKNLNDIGFYLTLAICTLPWVICLIYVCITGTYLI